MRLIRFVTLLAAAPLFLAPHPTHAAPNSFTETDLVSDVSGRAQKLDPQLVNPWGVVPGPTGVFWVSDNHSGVSTLYQPDGTKLGLVVTIPGGENTGVDLTDPAAPAFQIPSGDTTARAIFIFVSEGGTVSAWSNLVDRNNATQV